MCHEQGRWDGLTLQEMAERTAFVDYHMGLQASPALSAT